MSVDAHANFAYSTLTNAPGTAGTTFSVQTGDGAKFPTPPFNATVWPAGVQPTGAAGGNAEIIRVTSIATDDLTATRTQEGSTNRDITPAGYQIAATITVKTLTDAEKSFGVSTGGGTSGNTGVLFGPQVVLAGINNIRLSQSTDATSRITVSISDIAETATMWFPYNEAVNVVGQHGQSTLHIVPVPTPVRGPGDELHIDRLVFPIHFTNASNSTGSVTLSIDYGLYTKNASSLSLWGSTSGSGQITYSGNDASSQSKRGIHLFTMPWTTTIPGDRYYVGILSKTASAGANATISQVLISQINSQFYGLLNAATTRSAQWPLGFGVYSAQTAAHPSSIGFSQMDGSNSSNARPPSWFAISGTV